MSKDVWKYEYILSYVTFCIFRFSDLQSLLLAGLNMRTILKNAKQVTVATLVPSVRSAFFFSCWLSKSRFSALSVTAIKKDNIHIRVTHTYGSFTLDSQNLIQFLILNSNTHSFLPESIIQGDQVIQNSWLYIMKILTDNNIYF